ncbi:MAG: DUF5333 domain-containing protein [Rhodobacteraceae bacterium]|jgi:hypothetical protein|nr:DUF5333 domain-containing protein [Paracoccaceae bacterium]
MTRLSLLAALFLVAGPAFALEPLASERHINDSLRAGRIGDVIRKTCPTIKARMFVVMAKVDDLKSYALKKGYSRDEVEAFLKDPAQKNRLKAEAAAWLKAQGAVEGNTESYCRVGEAEIARGSLVGSLLRSTR